IRPTSARTATRRLPGGSGRAAPPSAGRERLAPASAETLRESRSEVAGRAPGPCLTSSGSVQPGLQEGLDLAATARLLEPCADRLALDDDERRKGRDVEAIDQVGSLFAGDAVELERLVVSPPLQHLGEESL